jgi:hypothetical protein
LLTFILPVDGLLTWKIQTSQTVTTGSSRYRYSDRDGSKGVSRALLTTMRFFYIMDTNVVLIILDACRSDYLFEYASKINQLGGSNLVFNRTVAPSRWSLPSHASLVTGVPPSKHGACTPLDDYPGFPLFTDLGEQGYTQYTVSSNHWAAGDDFRTEMDDVHNTSRPFHPSGLRIADSINKKKETSL